MVNLEAYKKACVNKANPVMHCNGKCQVLKKMKQHEGDNGATAKLPKFNHFEEVISSKSFFPILELSSTIFIASYYTYNEDYSSNYLGSVFHPPGV